MDQRSTGNGAHRWESSMTEDPKLSDEDLERVQQFISSGYNSTERGPFRALALLAVTWGVVIALGVVSYYIGKWAGYL